MIYQRLRSTYLVEHLRITASKKQTMFLEKIVCNSSEVPTERYKQIYQNVGQSKVQKRFIYKEKQKPWNKCKHAKMPVNVTNGLTKVRFITKRHV